MKIKGIVRIVKIEKTEGKQDNKYNEACQDGKNSDYSTNSEDISLSK